ncbi:hypothetical protein FHS27_004743 [Rhodopirellula rubra]|uniref:Uncharacterized protein n=1 Tax=Aporhodopirellula rubra TaxID=980271 RepID=A0A7W5E370_9BACT|nr:hypothetical protein [Aporhodopirellula rubra]
MRTELKAMEVDYCKCGGQADYQYTTSEGVSYWCENCVQLLLEDELDAD